jgi:hypothetical protein
MATDLKYARFIKEGQDIGAELTEKQRADCDNPWSCEECDYNEVCDEIQIAGCRKRASDSDARG